MNSRQAVRVRQCVLPRLVGIIAVKLVDFAAVSILLNST